ncbi:MAG: putative acetyltransferase, partial [Labilithrix sp.]|nr:putative acetyltransferase [Labilithrix sp.]
DLVLRRARLDDEQEVLRAHREATDVPNFLHHYRDGMSFARYLEVLAERELGVDLSMDRVPSTLLFAFVGSRIVGRASIRHRLNGRLDRVGGHIGYAVVPQFRRKGYATEILRQSLDIAKNRFGIRRALVTCDDDNVGSIRVIEKNGGVLQDVVWDADLPKPKRRYWIEI